MSIHNCGNKMSDIPLGGMEALKGGLEQSPSEKMESRIIGIVQELVALERLASDDPDAFLLVAVNCDHIGEISSRAMTLALKGQAVMESINAEKAVRGIN